MWHENLTPCKTDLNRTISIGSEAQDADAEEPRAVTTFIYLRDVRCDDGTNKQQEDRDRDRDRDTETERQRGRMTTRSKSTAITTANNRRYHNFSLPRSLVPGHEFV